MLIVQKYGGTSVGNTERIDAVANRVIESKKAGHDLVVVVSAMSGETARAATASGDKTDPKTGRKVLYWHDPMVPGQRFDKPGKSPFMDMQLVPKYAGSEQDSAALSVPAQAVQSLGMRTATRVWLSTLSRSTEPVPLRVPTNNCGTRM